MEALEACEETLEGPAGAAGAWLQALEAWLKNPEIWFKRGRMDERNYGWTDVRTDGQNPPVP